MTVTLNSQLKMYWKLRYKRSLTCTSTNTTSTNFCTIVLKFILVELLINEIVLIEFRICNTQLLQISHRTIFPGPKNSTKQGPPVDESNRSNLF